LEIDHNLNFVFPIKNAEVVKPDPKDATKNVTVLEPLVWGYHVPISQEVFRANYRILAATKDALFREGVQYAGEVGLPIADLALLDAASTDAKKRETEDMGPAFIAELRRTLVLAPGEKGFEYLTADAALQRKIISADEWHDAECVLIFFTCVSTVSLRTKRGPMIEALVSVLKGSMTSLTPMEFLASLRPSTQEEASAPIPPLPAPSLVPS